MRRDKVLEYLVLIFGSGDIERMDELWEEMDEGEVEMCENVYMWVCLYKEGGNELKMGILDRMMGEEGREILIGLGY